MKTHTCCEKCSGRIEDENSFASNYGCQNDRCRCHTSIYEEITIVGILKKLLQLGIITKFSKIDDTKYEITFRSEPL